MFLPTIFNIGDTLYCQQNTPNTASTRMLRAGAQVTVTDIDQQNGAIVLAFSGCTGWYDKSNFELAAQADHRASTGGQRSL